MAEISSFGLYYYASSLAKLMAEISSFGLRYHFGCEIGYVWILEEYMPGV